MSTVTIEEAQAKLPEILAALNPGDQLAMVDAGQEVARLTRSSRKQRPCKAGCYRKAAFWMAPDFVDPQLDAYPITRLW
jgi:antitoxin (DNA-binding transcriptional repressor) of toxin-antitoxin stability system